MLLGVGVGVGVGWDAAQRGGVMEGKSDEKMSALAVY